MDAVNADGSIVVNGITVAISALTHIADGIVPGKSVRLEGQFTAKGLLIAREVKNKGEKHEGKSTEAKVEGIVELVNRDENGRVVSLVVDGLTVAVDALTELEIDLEPGVEVEIDAIVSGGKFTAREIEKTGKGRSQSNKAAKKEVKLEGTIEALQTDNRGRVISVTVNGIQVAVAALERSKGSLQVGQTVELETTNTGGVLRANKVETKKPQKAKQEFDEFGFSGIVEIIERDGAGVLLSFMVNGKKIAVEDLTKMEGDVEVGATVKLEGIVVDGVLLASEIKGTKDKGKPAAAGSKSQGADKDGRKPSTAGSKGQSSSKVETNKAEKSKQEFERFVIQGIVEALDRDDAGRLLALTVNGQKIAVENLTEVEGDVAVGASVKVEGTLSDGVLLASEIRGPKDEDKSGSDEDSGDSYNSSARLLFHGQ